MTVNISARNFSLTIAGVDRTANTINIALSQNELSDGGVFVTGSITLQANYNEVTDFTYLASPAIGENWARGASIVYQVANDSGTLVNHVLSGGALYILKEPAPPNAQFQITLEVGDQAALKNYRTADVDVSGVVAGVSTNRDTVIQRYLNAATISNSISSVPYPFAFPQPKCKGSSFVDVAAKMARSANHILYTNTSGTVVNKAIDLAASPVATYRIGEDEQLFNQADSSGIETPIDELVISGIKTKIESITYPKVTVNTVFDTFKYQKLNITGNLIEWEIRNYRYITKRTTITDYGWNGAEERVVTFVESGTFRSDGIENLATNPAFFLLPLSESTNIKRYDSKNRLILDRTENDKFVQSYTFNFIPTSFTTSFPFSFSVQRTSESDVTKTYTYDDFDVLQSIRTETQRYIRMFNYIRIFNTPVLEEAFYGKTAKVESWSANTYSVENFFKPATIKYNSSLVYNRIGFLGAPTLTTLEGDWETAGSEFVYATDGSTKPPATTYRKPYEPIEEQITAKLTARPFAGQSFYSRSRPIEVPFLESQMQATEYGNTYLALLYGRKQSFEFGTALSNTLLSLTPLSRINILWRGVRYNCLTDGLSWSHTQTQMAIGMRLIVLGTALESDPPETMYPAIVASALIQGTASQSMISIAELSALDFLGGTSRQEMFASAFVSQGTILQGTARQTMTAVGSVT